MKKIPIGEAEYKLFGIPVWSKTLKRTVSYESDLLSPSQWLLQALGGLPTDSGIEITEEKALQFSAVYACTRVISEAIACLPKHVYHRIDKRTRENLPEHRVSRLINFQPSEFYTPFDYFNTQTAIVLLWGNAFTVIHRDSNYLPESLEIIDPTHCRILYDDIEIPGKNRTQRVLVYKLSDGRLIMPYDMLHFKGLGFNGVQGKGVIANFAKESIGLSIVAERFGSRFFGKNTNLSTYFTMPGSLSEPAHKRLRDQLQEITGIENTFSKPPIFEFGLEPKNITIPPEQAQFLGTRQHQVEEVCRWFKVQPHLIQHLLRSTNNNIEQQSIEFVMHTVLPWCTRIEQEFNIKLFTTKEMMNTYVKINVEGFLRGDMNAQREYYKSMVLNGIWSPNEVRELQDRNPYEGGDEYWMPANMLPANESPGLQKINNKKQHENTN